jgi:hypothetical protein
MKRFWQWMKEKEYGDSEDNKEYLTYHCNKSQSTTIRATPQMLIGYMLEYIRNHKQNKPGYIMTQMENAIFRDDPYQALESIIKEMDGEE